MMDRKEKAPARNMFDLAMRLQSPRFVSQWLLEKGVSPMATAQLTQIYATMRVHGSVKIEVLG